MARTNVPIRQFAESPGQAVDAWEPLGPNEWWDEEGTVSSYDVTSLRTQDIGWNVRAEGLGSRMWGKGGFAGMHSVPERRSPEAGTAYQTCADMRHALKHSLLIGAVVHLLYFCYRQSSHTRQPASGSQTTLYLPVGPGLKGLHG